MNARSTPLDALKAYRKAHMRKDLDAVVELIDFDQEAYEKLGNEGILDNQSNHDAVRALAESLRREYRRQIDEKGFGRPMNHRRSKVISCLTDSENLATFSMRNGTMFWAQRVVCRDGGWRILRG